MMKGPGVERWHVPGQLALCKVQSLVGPSLSFMMENDDPLACYKRGCPALH